MHKVFLSTFGIALLTWTQPTLALDGVVTSAHPLATAAGIEMLKQGGNAIDAAIATSLALSVVEPQSSGLGGGGFALVYTGRTAEARVLDFRETAPLNASATMYQDASGKALPRLSLDGYLAAGIPGQLAGLLALQETYGSLPLATLAAPAIRYARDGFAVTPLLSGRLANAAERLGRDPAAASIFLPGGKPPTTGQLLKQFDLAQTIELWATTGGESFYRGETAERIAGAMATRGGLIGKPDLAGYRILWRLPLSGSYREVQIVTPPPPASGPILLEMLNILENFDLSRQTPLQRSHLVAQAMERGYADRSRFMGDPAFVPVPVAALTAKSYGRALSLTIDPLRASPASAITPGSLFPESVRTSFKRWEAPRPVENTTHFSIIDAEGNAVSITQTVNGAFGAGVVVPGTGVLLNNEMDDFASAPGTPNLFGLVGSTANAIAPGKRPLSSTVPSLLIRNGRPWIALGSPGGSFITNAVLQTIVNLIDLKLDLKQAVDAPRLHHQWLPDRLLIEADYPVPAAEFERLGYRVSVSQAAKSDVFGAVNASQAEFDSQIKFISAPDRRREGTGQVWTGSVKPLAPNPALSRPR